MRPGFRQDIQGLRALAVVLVILDHADIGPFHGGFIGVDVFFVISGFLITGLLVSEAERTGRASLLGFYARRARRILPAATLVIVVTVVASILFLSAVEATGVIQDALWATFFLANFKFASDGTDYFQNDTPPSPLQHYWSLSVEEQFYLVWPLLVLLLCVYA
ncbi:MAG TPA: acyltransferase, partial [Nocardioides sp.]|nr:acyltransferase [Nocardioides sp.]